MNDEIEKEINERIMKLVNEATDYAENAPYAEPEAAMKYVYAEDEVRRNKSWQSFHI